VACRGWRTSNLSILGTQMRTHTRFLIFPWRRDVSAAALAAGLTLAAYAQSSKPPLAEEVFKNVQVLKGIPVGEFMDTMGFFSASLGSNCVHCHVDESLTHWDKFAEDVPRKRVARQMIQMVNALNKANFGGSRVVTCYSCHHGDVKPENVPSLLSQYSLPVEDPNKVEIVPDASPGPSADQILDKYLKAIGDSQRLTSFIAKGTYEGYDTYEQKVPLEIFAKAPNQRTTIVHTQSGDITTTFDGRSGWVAAVDKPVTLLPLDAGGELDGARMEGDLAFPAHIKSSLSAWRVGFPVTAINDHPVQIVQGTGAGGTRVKLYFEVESGVLVRTLRYTNTAVGLVPTQVDYSDYREVSGVRMPFHWVVTWTDGQSTIDLSNVEANVPIDPDRFARPAPAVVRQIKVAPSGATR
jgi:outer membrane lipoprotein-sorting protein